MIFLWAKLKLSVNSILNVLFASIPQLDKIEARRHPTFNWVCVNIATLLVRACLINADSSFAVKTFGQQVVSDNEKMPP